MPETATPASRAHRAVALGVLLLAGALPLGAQEGPAVRYRISFPDRVHHEASVEIRYTGLPTDAPLELRMSRTSPGRYALHEFAKNVYSFRATDGEGRRLDVHRPDPHQWDVSGHDGVVEVRYTLFADRADGTYSGVDESHAHLNAPATFMWARGLTGRPVELSVVVPDGSRWRVATQLPARGGSGTAEDPFVHTAPDHGYFLDSPVEVSDFQLREWEVDGRTIRVAMHHAGTEAELDRYAEHTRAIVLAQRDVWGALPDFDHGSYTFLACYLPWVSGDGMEHRNSTVLTSTGTLRDAMVGLLGTVAHEFFHAWSIERIRPASLEPFDFEAANMSRELWFGEGFTSYYDDLTLARAGIIDADAFGRRMGSAVNAVVNAPGRRFFSPVEMSMQAPFVDAATSVDPTNRANTFISYYTWGSVIALGLDLTLRSRFPGLTLDDYMRAVWERHPHPGRPYDVEDLEEILGEVTGEPAFAADFFDRFVRGRDVPDFASLLAPAGFELGLRSPGAPILHRTALQTGSDGVLVAAVTRIGTPLYDAGVSRGDVLLSVAGVEVDEPGDVDGAMEGRSPGELVEVEYRSRGRRRSATVALQEDPSIAVRPVERPTAAQVRFREAWLGGG